MTLYTRKFIRTMRHRLAPLVQSKRRGSVVVFAVAALAVMAIAAVAYLTVVRIERSSAAAYSRVVNFQQQINAVVGEASALLAADLFGNKIVTNATPRSLEIGSQVIRISPRMFEDGGYIDFPQVHIGPDNNETFNVERRANPVSGDSFTLDPRAEGASRVAVPDDAWLASTTPIAPGLGVQLWSIWPQITNMRSGYRFFVPQSNPNNGLWVRDDGRFADLGQFWEQATTDDRGNPGADLSPDSLDDNPDIGPAVYSDRNGPWAGVDQQVFNRIIGEMAQIEDDSETPPTIPPGGNYSPMDTRFWADTDGDGFPDARWQELDVLGELFGLRWVVASRITDNSALANVNAHIVGRDWLNPANANAFADGLTPADVDLHRLFEHFWTPFPQGGARHPDVDNNLPRLDLVFEDHLNIGIGAENIFEQIRVRTPADEDIFRAFRASLFHHDSATVIPPPNIPNYPLTAPNTMSRVHREVFWRGFGASPQRPVATSGVGYPLGDEVSLRAFHGFNYESLVSKIEQRIDGPEDGTPNYLPPRGEGPYPGQERIGLMRSKEPGSTHVWRLPSHPPNAAQPQAYSVYPNNRGRIERIQRDVRRMLTTIGGAGNHSPIPPVSRAVNNLGQEIFGGRTSNRKIPLADFETPDTNLNRRRELGQQAFEAFVWALAPMATDQPLGHGMTSDQLEDPFIYAARTDYHYGGGEKGPATAMQQALNFSSPEIGPSYALLRAASMVANLVAGSNRPENPAEYRSTIARLYPRHQYPSQQGLTNAPLVTNNVIPLTMRFSHGDIGDSLDPEELIRDIMPEELVGNELHGVSLIGLQHQPYIVEATSFAAYTAAPNTSGEAVAVPEPEISDANGFINERIGAGFAFELRNPWPDDINLTPYHLRIANNSGGVIRIGLDQVDTGGGITAAPVLRGGQSIIFYVESSTNLAGFTELWEPIRDKWREEIEARESGPLVQQVARLEPDAILPGGSATSGVFFQNLGQNDAATLMLVANDAVNDVEVLVDRLAAPEGSTNFPATIVSAPYSFPPSNPPLRGTARWAISSTLYRPTDNNNPSGGFPGYVVERRQTNVLEVSNEILIPWVMEPMTHVDWLADPGPDLSVLVERAFDEDAEGIEFLLGENKGIAENLPPFQLFIPRGPLAYTSELHMLGVFAHTYKHSAAEISMVNAHRAPRLTLPSASLGVSAGDDYWLTVGEQLGADWHLAYDASTPPSGGGNLNPYLGVLDPTRFVLSDDVTDTGDLGSVENLPDTLAMPLALRVFDPFDALTTVSPLVNGRININTASGDILDLIPFMTTGLQSPSPLENNNEIRRRLIENYRFDVNPDLHTASYYNHLDDPLLDYPMPGKREDMTGIPGLRDVDPVRKINGFVSTGELAILDAWDTDGNPQAGNNAKGFLELGKNGVPPNPPFVMRDRFYNSNGDPEKRLAAFRAMSNIVTTRSDVFTMTFIIRGYDPEAIEAIRIDTNDDGLPNNPDEALNRLAPTFEQRWLAMFDRSDVRRPTDRPRVLLLVELPLDQAQTGTE